MPRTLYEALGRIVWTGGVWYFKRRYRAASRRGRGRRIMKRMGTGALVAVAIGGAIAAAQRRGNRSG